MDKKKTLLVVAGPTAVGKTSLAIDLALHYKTEIVSADSRQFYREMSIGTAKPALAELEQVKHHFINSHSISETFTAGAFEKESIILLNTLFQQHDIVELVGGSGLFIKAVCEGFDSLPAADPVIRDFLNTEYQNKGISFLNDRLKIIDPDYYKIVDKENPQRLIRAIEIFESTGQAYSSLRVSNTNLREFNVIKIGLNLPRNELYDRINHRVDLMVQQGLVEEVKKLLPFKNLNALNTVGYTELFRYLDGEIDFDTAIDQIKQNSRRYAKRQLTWFRKDKQMVWFEATEPLKNFTTSIEKLLQNS